MSDRSSPSLLRLRLRKFRRLRRGYYSFLILIGFYALTMFNALLISNKALIVQYGGHYYFPVFSYHEGTRFGQTEVRGKRHYGETDYRALKDQFASEAEGNWVLLTPYPYSPNESLLYLPGSPPHGPSQRHWFGTDDRGRDILARLVYGFRISMNFALFVTILSYLSGTLCGAALGFFGGRLDIYGQRLIEVWASVPFLYTVIILSSMFRPNFYFLACLLTLFGWMGISFYVRGEFYREKAKDYVAAARSIGERDRAIMLRYILPNALTPIISFAPFAIVGNITALVALDYLGFGLPAPTPSWGELIHQGREHIFAWHLVVFPLLAMFLTLQLTVFIGEALREAFDPKVFSRLR
ncbi:MAG: ABC transporter permease subunit [Pirellulales bacterium]